MISTERLQLRKWRPGDADELYLLARDPDVGPAAGWPVHTSPENSLDIIKGVLSAPETYAVVLRDGGTLLGSVGLHFVPHVEAGFPEKEYELGYWIGKPFWGSGYAPEAAKALLCRLFGELGANVCWCCHYDGNSKSKRVIEKLGFRYVAEYSKFFPELGIERKSLAYRLEGVEFLKGRNTNA